MNKGNATKKKQQRLPKHHQLCPTLAIYRKLEGTEKLPVQLRSEALATGQVSLDDLRLLDTVGRYRFVRVDHLAVLLERHAKSVHRRVVQLYHHGYLSRFIRMKRLRTGLDFGSEKMAHGLDTRGYNALEEKRVELEEERGQSITAVSWRKDHTRRSEIFIEHNLAIATVRACFEISLRGHQELELLEWRQDEGLRHGFSYLDAETRERVKASVRPDAYFAIRERGKRWNFLLEVDENTEDHSVLQRKFQRLYNYLRTRTYRERYADKNPENVRILFVCKDSGKPTMSYKRGERTPMTRFDRMFVTLEGVHAKRDELRRLFWFARSDSIDLSAPERILGAIWRRRGMKEGQGHALFGPALTARGVG